MRDVDCQSSPFAIASSHDSFAQKQRNLFAELDNAEKNNKRKHPTEEEMEVDDTPSANRSRSAMKQFKRKESIFKRPEAPISQCLQRGRVPNFRLNPKKWTKYTLADVSEDDMSESGNTNAALSFLRDLEKRKDGQSDEPDELPKKITFKRYVALKPAENSGGDAKVSFRSSKVVMPEYVVGQAGKKDRKKKGTSQMSDKQLRLDHLLEDDDAD